MNGFSVFQQHNVFVLPSPATHYPVFISTSEFDLLAWGNTPYHSQKLSELNTVSDVFAFHREPKQDLAVIIYEKKQKELYLFKDFSGTANLFYGFSPRGWIISSSVAVVRSALPTQTIDPNAAASFVKWQFATQPATLTNEVKTVGNGQCIHLDQNGNARVVSDHFSLSIDPNVQNFSEEEMAQALRQHMISAHQKLTGQHNAVLISGGLDSQVMAITLKRDLGVENLIGLHFSVKGAEETEWRDAQSVCKALGIAFHHAEIDPNTPVDVEACFLNANSPYLGQLFIRHMMNDAGLTGAHVFAGQDTRLYTPAVTRLDPLYWQLASNPLTRQLLLLLKPIGALANYDRQSVQDRFLALLGSLGMPHVVIAQRHFRLLLSRNGLPNSPIERKLLTDLLNLDPANFRGKPREFYNAIACEQWKRQHGFDSAYMAEAIASTGNKAMMPFFDAQLNNFGASLPFDTATRITSGRAAHGQKKTRVNKYLLRKAYENDLDHSLIFRQKAVCRTNHMLLNGSLRPLVNDFAHDRIAPEFDLGRELNFDRLRRLAKQRDGRWTPNDNSVALMIINALTLEMLEAQCRNRPTTAHNKTTSTVVDTVVE